MRAGNSCREDRGAVSFRSARTVYLSGRPVKAKVFLLVDAKGKSARVVLDIKNRRNPFRIERTQCKGKSTFLRSMGMVFYRHIHRECRAIDICGFHNVKGAAVKACLHEREAVQELLFDGGMTRRKEDAFR